MIKTTKLLFFIIASVLLLNTVNAKINYYYEIKLNYTEGNVTLDSLIIEAFEEKIESEGTYVAEIVSLDKKILNVTFFDIPLTIIFERINPTLGGLTGSEETRLNKSETTITLPYYDNAKEIRIYDPNITLLLTIPVSQFSKNLCGDGICQVFSGENFRNCRLDCSGAADKVCDGQKDGICDPDCSATQDIDCTSKLIEERKEAERGAKIAEIKEKALTWWPLAVVIIIVVLIIILLLRKKQKQQ